MSQDISPYSRESYPQECRSTVVGIHSSYGFHLFLGQGKVENSCIFLYAFFMYGLGNDRYPLLDCHLSPI